MQAQILKQSHKNEAKAAYEATLRIEPENIEVQADFADFLARSAEYEAARKWAQSVLEREPNNTRAKAALGMALAEQNDPKAFALLRAGLQKQSPRCSYTSDFASFIVEAGQAKRCPILDQTVCNGAGRDAGRV